MNRIEANNLSNPLNICDYLPLASTITNLVDIFYKCVILPFLSQETIQQQPLYTRLQEKSLARCCALLVPILGNIVILFLDCCQKQPHPEDPFSLRPLLPPLEGLDQPLAERLLEEEPLADIEEFLTGVFEEKGVGHLILGYSGNWLSEQEKASLERVRANGLLLQHESEEIRKHFDVVKAAVEADGMALEFTDDGLKDNQEIVVAALRTDSRALQFASDRLVKMIVEIVSGALEFANDAAKDNEEIVAASVRQFPYTLQYASDRLKGNRAIVEEAIKRGPWALEYASEALRDDDDLVGKAEQEGRIVLQYASARLRSNPQFAKRFVEKNALALEVVDDTIKANKEIVLAAVQAEPYAIRFASAALQNDEEIINAARLKRSGWTFFGTVCDYIPFISTITNIVTLFSKCVILPFLSQGTIENSPYWFPLQEKSLARCCSLLVPVVGNIAVRALDYQNQIKSPLPQLELQSEQESGEESDLDLPDAIPENQPLEAL
jgi:hypothetical protein